MFGEPARHGAQLAPRGDRLAFLAPRDGVTNLWVVSIGAMDDARPVTDDRGLGVRSFAWAHDNTTLIYALEEAANGATRLYAIDTAAADAAPRALTPAGANAEIAGLSASDPSGVVVSLNQRDPNWPDLVRIDLTSARRTMLLRNSNSAAVRGFSHFVLDKDNGVRLGVKSLADGSEEVFARDANGRWYSLLTIPFEDAPSSQPIAFETGGRTFLMLDSTGRDRAALVRVDAYTAAKTVLGESARADVVDVWLDPGSNAPEAFAAEYLRQEWRAIDPDAQADLDFLDRQLTGDFTVTSRSADDARWIVVEEGPTTAARSYLYERGDAANRRLTQLFRHRPALDQAALQPMTPVEIEARDGLTLVSYLTLPIGSDANADGRPEAAVPLVLAPHGGPWMRDSYGFNPLHQWLANRGYAVLSVNFRGSTGLGKAFLNAGNGQWGARMQDDLLDAAQWAVESGVAQPDRIAIVGSGFGGYAALAGLAFTPEQFRCAAAYGAPANLTAMVDGAPGLQREEMLLRVGDIRTAEGRSSLRERSPLMRASQMRRPLLLALGGRDALASRAEFDQIAQSLRGRRIQLSSIIFPEEGRDLVRPQNRLAYYSVLEHFLGSCLGGRVEPVGGAFEGATMTVYDGATIAPGLSGFVRRASAPAQPAVQEVREPIAAAPEEAPQPAATEISAPAPAEQ
ncbi:MAG TPA: prolyl oligopeptidase family serine peptidase [Candidatus Binatia bacterium]|nr:prolyl oligopeptidase family serine peptidase [Candidatus Binatia bacterium]